MHFPEECLEMRPLRAASELVTLASLAETPAPLPLALGARPDLSELTLTSPSVNPRELLEDISRRPAVPTSQQESTSTAICLHVEECSKSFTLQDLGVALPNPDLPENSFSQPLAVASVVKSTLQFADYCESCPPGETIASFLQTNTPEISQLTDADLCFVLMHEETSMIKTLAVFTAFDNFVQVVSDENHLLYLDDDLTSVGGAEVKRACIYKHVLCLMLQDGVAPFRIDCNGYKMHSTQVYNRRLAPTKNPARSELPSLRLVGPPGAASASIVVSAYGSDGLKIKDFVSYKKRSTKMLVRDLQINNQPCRDTEYNCQIRFEVVEGSGKCLAFQIYGVKLAASYHAIANEEVKEQRKRNSGRSYNQQRRTKTRED